jgi:hypothetical protein
MKFTTPLHLVPRLRMGGAIPLLPCILHGMNRENFAYKTPGLHLNYRTGSLQIETDRGLQCHFLYIRPSHTEDLSSNNPSIAEIYLNYITKF